MPFRSVCRAHRVLYFSISTLAAIFLALACIRDTRDVHAVTTVPERVPSNVVSRTWPICDLVGPRSKDLGVYGTDLGFTVKEPGNERLAILFGDTWAKPIDACHYPVFQSDDLQATLPAERPISLRAGAPGRRAAKACDSLKYELRDAKESTSWPRIRLFATTSAKKTDGPLDTGSLRTPVAAFSDGRKVFAVYSRMDTVRCDRSRECPEGMACSTDPGYRGKSLGECATAMDLREDAPRIYCRDGADCGPLVACTRPEHGVCLATEPFEFVAGGKKRTPEWYRDDPRRGLGYTVYIAAAIWPDRPTDYAVIHRFPTHRFLNVAARTVTFFDPDHPEHNDYRPGFHTLLLWGRSHFVATKGAQILPFLLYVPLDELRGEHGPSRWKPRFFAGYDAQGRPRWSLREADAAPVYGAEAELVDGAPPRIRWTEPEFDYVNQMSVSWIDPLQRWVMLYGGDVPAFLVFDPSTNRTLPPVHLQRAAGAVHLRTARHPWGRAMRDRPEREGWSSPDPVLTREVAAPFLACGSGGKKELPGCLEDADPNGPLDLMAKIAGLTTKTTPGKFVNVTASCLGGELAMAAQDAISGSLIGRLYGANVIDEWTEDVTEQVDDLGYGERAVEIYWNASTWNPYQVVLFKTELRGTP